MRLGKTAAIAATAGILVGGCSSKESMSPTTIEADLNFQKLEFLENPDGNFSAGDCGVNPTNWVVHIDTNPEDVEGVENVRTIGMAGSREADGSPIFLLGATIEGLGDAAYRLAIQDSKSSEQVNVDLDESSYSRVLDGTSDYDAVFSARLGDDGKAYFKINCLPNFGFSGELETTPLEELPILDSETTIPQTTESEFISV